MYLDLLGALVVVSVVSTTVSIVSVRTAKSVVSSVVSVGIGFRGSFRSSFSFSIALIVSVSVKKHRMINLKAYFLFGNTGTYGHRPIVTPAKQDIKKIIYL